ncbi:YjbQ family protein [Sporosarcina sp. Marseille-Q4063]|uniref:secondary thiamine-phosphate synthase enzyme YjbQ n=1 Tax=Sporosarcina sp. Marseille-Q4063 TaxID=2810514 RepID=UPI001BAFCC1D|nr:secondary thiamine-phosphate synthase enzyme YjbQ [Sporosarcina sp. Marseille-Q4063]QUW23045.1 YjbQ family protein [Sporosarcina sp. Marseille-Q4063]
MLGNFKLKTRERDIVILNEEIFEFVKESGVKSGTCTIFIPHTTAGLTITSFWDPKGLEDLQDEICRIIPTRIDFKHQHDTPQDAAGHIKSSFIGVTMNLIIDNGELLVGHSQGIYFLEFDGPRNREYFVKIQADEQNEGETE